MKTVVVGGVAGGASTAARLRRLDESAQIIVLERGEYVSFANCGLPYHIGGVIPDRDSLLLPTPESLGKSLALDVRTGQDVVRIDRDAKQVEVHDVRDGRRYRESYDTLGLCLDAEPVRPSIPGAGDPSVDVLRDIADMDGVTAHLEKGAQGALVVGGSYIGLELTEAFRTRGGRRGRRRGERPPVAWHVPRGCEGPGGAHRRRAGRPGHCRREQGGRGGGQGRPQGREAHRQGTRREVEGRRQGRPRRHQANQLTCRSIISAWVSRPAGPCALEYT